jgi:hypothetical protein
MRHLVIIFSRRKTIFGLSRSTVMGGSSSKIKITAEIKNMANITHEVFRVLPFDTGRNICCWLKPRRRRLQEFPIPSPQHSRLKCKLSMEQSFENFRCGYRITGERITAANWRLSSRDDRNKPRDILMCQDFRATSELQRLSGSESIFRSIRIHQQERFPGRQLAMRTM